MDIIEFHPVKAELFDTLNIQNKVVKHLEAHAVDVIARIVIILVMVEPKSEKIDCHCC